MFGLGGRGNHLVGKECNLLVRSVIAIQCLLSEEGSSRLCQLVSLIGMLLEAYGTHRVIEF
jgi:hypothetical protein